VQWNALDLDSENCMKLGIPFDDFVQEIELGFMLGEKFCDAHKYVHPGRVRAERAIDSKLPPGAILAIRDKESGRIWSSSEVEFRRGIPPSRPPQLVTG
jgi:hypothetical protein